MVNNEMRHEMISVHYIHIYIKDNKIITLQKCLQAANSYFTNTLILHICL